MFFLLLRPFSLATSKKTPFMCVCIFFVRYIVSLFSILRFLFHSLELEWKEKIELMIELTGQSDETRERVGSVG